MYNSCILTGRLSNFHFDDNKLVLMIKHSHKDGDMVLPVYTSFKPSDVLLDYLEVELFIGIKGFVTLNENAQVIIMAEKITFLPSKDMGGELNESK